MWKDDNPYIYDDDDLHGQPNPFAETSIVEEGHDSRQSNFNDSEESDLVRSASIGRRGKPSVVTNKGTIISTVPSPMSEKLQKMGVFESMDTWADEMRAQATAHAEASSLRPSPQPVQPPQQDPSWPTSTKSADTPFPRGTGYIDSSSSDTTSTLRPSKSQGEKSEEAQPPTPRNARMHEIIRAHNAASNMQPLDYDDKEIEGGSSWSPMRRLPRLDMDAVRTAEARGSLTSLPDMIRRGAKLAAMIGDGKRPGSRLNNLNDFNNVDPGEKEEGDKLTEIAEKVIC